MTLTLTRRTVLAGAAAVSTFSIIKARSARAANVLRIGDMNATVLQPVLEAAGLHKDLDYTIEWSKFAAGAPELEALNAGAIDVGETGDIPFLFAYAAGTPVRSVGAIKHGPTQLVAISRPEVAAKSISDLKGRKIAVNRGGAGHIVALELLDRAGLTPSDVELVFLGPVDAKPAFASGTVDAWIVWPPYSTLAIEQDGGKVFANLSDTGGGGTYNYLLASVDAINTKREFVADFKRRIFEARRWSLEHPDETAQIIADLTKLPVELAKRVRLEVTPTPVEIDDSIVAALQSAADVFARHEVIKPLKVDAAFDRSFAVPA
ncbi:aliphatic sulfonate ABC transporter substrate-binding protein [Zavarzinia sp. CC-PAN008]|uniref:aliphatic sulfonate ABC transporter substrate-binding protein n=1 Tax=Zavarzinia sp. CC-PAN008 TaxID=3243332 RepID=UPI003F743DE7